MGGKVWLPGGQPRRPSSGRLNGALWSRATEGHWPGGGRFCKVSQQSASESGRPGGGADRGPGWWTERRARPRRVEGPQAREGVPGLQGEPEMHSTGQRGTVGTGGKGGLLRATLVSQNVVHDPPACAPPGGGRGSCRTRAVLRHQPRSDLSAVPGTARSGSAAAPRAHSPFESTCPGGARCHGPAFGSEEEKEGRVARREPQVTGRGRSVVASAWSLSLDTEGGQR